MTTGAKLETALRAAKAAAMPPDQIARFLRAGYIPQPKQMMFHATARRADHQGSPDRIGMGGARGPGKSHAIMAQVAIDDCQRFPGLDVLFLRKVGKAARESLDKLRMKTFLRIPHKYNRHEGIIRFQNESTIVVGHFNSEGDIDNYLGIEYDVIVTEEETQLSKTKIDMLEGSLRSTKKGWRPRRYGSTNPGGVGHQDFKRTFVLPWREKREERTRFIPATYRDNAFLDDGYIRYLESLTGLLGRMWRDGDWDVGAGMFFSNWSYELHTIKPFPIPRGWPVWMSMDYGWSHPTAIYWHMKDPGNDTIFTIAEHVQNRWLVPQHAARIFEINELLGAPHAHRPGILAGHDVFAQRGDSKEMTIAEQYADKGIILKRARTDRLAGAANLLKRLGNQEAGLKPSWFIFDTCTRLADCIPSMLSDPHRPQDVLKVNADDEGFAGDDPYDAARYGIFGQTKKKRKKGRTTTVKQ